MENSSVLYIFVKSERPDAYLNPILYCLEHESINKVMFLSIQADDVGSQKSKNNLARTLQLNVSSFLQYLAEDGEYKCFEDFDTYKVGDKVPLQDFYPNEIDKIKTFYKKFVNNITTWENKPIKYKNLKDEMRELYSNNLKVIFDITAIDKKYIGDIYAISTLIGIEDIYTFALNIKPNFIQPWTMLYDKLDLSKGEYEYKNVVDTDIFRDCSNSIKKERNKLITTILIAITFVFIYMLATKSGINQIVTNLSSAASIISLLIPLTLETIAIARERLRKRS